MKYVKGKQIGDPGGFGNVYVCKSEQGASYAVKILKELTPFATERFKKEIRLTNRLSHPNIVKIIAFNVDASEPWYIMNLYSSSLLKVIPSLYGEYNRQYKIISAILNGLIYLHSEGVLHRDLKPQNILYNTDDDMVLNDFGLGRQINSKTDCENRLTQIGDAFGTVRYTAPEQLLDANCANEKSDIFSIGKIIEDIVTNFLSSSVPSEQLVYIIDKCTNPTPAKRFNDALELKGNIDNAYLQLLGLIDSNKVNDYLEKLMLGTISNEDVFCLAKILLDSDNSDKIEEFFGCLPKTLFQKLEQLDADLLIALIIKLKNYFVSQGWNFGYTDKIGGKCETLYQTSNNAIIKANLLYSIIEVGISHNRFYVMGIAANLLRKMDTTTAEGLELASLLKNGPDYLELSKLGLQTNELLACLKSFY